MKKKLRQQARLALSGIPRPVFVRKTQLACSEVVSMPEFQRARTVMLYMPMPEEVDTTAIAQAAWAAGKTVLAPKTILSDRSMCACPITSMTSGLTPHHHYGILEPADGQPWPLEQIDLVLVPGLVFDRRGGRLGRGAGFYDRFLSQPMLRAASCGLALAEQVVDEVPVFDHDRRVDILVTDQEVLDFRRPGDPP